jgi:hypothetical protein
MISRELTILGNLVGSYNDLAELTELHRQGGAGCRSSPAFSGHGRLSTREAAP